MEFINMTEEERKRQIKLSKYVKKNYLLDDYILIGLNKKTNRILYDTNNLSMALNLLYTAYVELLNINKKTSNKDFLLDQIKYSNN